MGSILMRARWDGVFSPYYHTSWLGNVFGPRSTNNVDYSGSVFDRNSEMYSGAPPKGILALLGWLLQKELVQLLVQ